MATKATKRRTASYQRDAATKAPKLTPAERDQVLSGMAAASDVARAARPCFTGVAMTRIAASLDAITEDRRASYLFDTKSAAEAVGCPPNKFNDWWQRTRRKLIELYLSQPGELATEIAVLIATAEAERQRRSEQ